MFCIAVTILALKNFYIVCQIFLHQTGRASCTFINCAITLTCESTKKNKINVEFDELHSFIFFMIWQSNRHTYQNRMKINNFQRKSRRFIFIKKFITCNVFTLFD